MEEKKNKIYKILILIILTAFVSCMITGFSVYTYFQNNLIYSSQEGAMIVSDNSSDLEKYLKKVKSTIDKYYLWNDDIKEDDLKKGAVQGYVAALGDQYTEYIPADEMKEYTESINGNFVGIGIYMTKDTESNRVVVYYPIPNSPAEKIGINAGDYIISVDGVEYTADDFENISSYIKGEEGTIVNIVVERNGEKLSFDIKREKVNTNIITTKIIENNIGYIKLPSFDEGSADDFKSELEKLISGGAKSVILDLRNNGGGLVDESTKIADFLLEKGNTIITTVDKNNKKEVTLSKNKPLFSLPIVVLVNENSASASEILACSLQDNERATIIGKKTYGKGIIQTLLSLSDGSGLKITTQEYYTPKESTIHKVGVKPDYEVELPDNVTSIYSVEEDKDTQLRKAIEILK